MKQSMRRNTDLQSQQSCWGMHIKFTIVKELWTPWKSSMETKFSLVPNPQDENIDQVLSAWCLIYKKLVYKEVNLIGHEQKADGECEKNFNSFLHKEDYSTYEVVTCQRMSRKHDTFSNASKKQFFD